VFSLAVSANTQLLAFFKSAAFGVVVCTNGWSVSSTSMHGIGLLHLGCRESKKAV